MEEFKCPNCNGVISFDTTTQMMKCPYCDSEFEPESLKEYDEILKESRESTMDWQGPENLWSENESENLLSYVCSSCGGEIIGDKTLGATSCPYCNNNTVFTKQFSGDLKPDLVIPFKYDKDAAKKAMYNHFKGKKLLPKNFKNEQHIDEIKGIYVPFWLYDACADGHFRFHCTKLRTWVSDDYIYTETRHYSAVRDGSISFINVPVDGSQKMADDLMESLEPYNLNEAVDFKTAYLAGFFADRYDVSVQNASVRANERISITTEEAIKGTLLNYSASFKEAGSVSVEKGKTKYALLPVWILNTTWKGEKYVFAMNGQTGKLVGNLPVDKGLFHKYLWGISGISALIAFALSYLIWLI